MMALQHCLGGNDRAADTELLYWWESSVLLLC